MDIHLFDGCVKYKKQKNTAQQLLLQKRKKSASGPILKSLLIKHGNFVSLLKKWRQGSKCQETFEMLILRIFSNGSFEIIFVESVDFGLLMIQSCKGTITYCLRVKQWNNKRENQNLRLLHYLWISFGWHIRVRIAVWIEGKCKWNTREIELLVMIGKSNHNLSQRGKRKATKGTRKSIVP